MTFAVNSLGSVGDTNARSNYTCSIQRAPTANALVLVGIVGSDAVGTPVQPSSVSGAGMVFSLATSSLTYNPTTPGSELHNLSVWRGMAASPVSSVITANFSNDATGCAMLVVEVSGVTTSGTSGSSALSASGTSRVDGSSKITIIADKSAFSTANGWISFHGHSSSGDASVTENWTKIDMGGYATPSTGIHSAYTTRSTGSSLAWFTAGLEDRASIILELVADNEVVASVFTYNRVIQQPYRLPQPPQQIGMGDSKALFNYLATVVRILNSEAYISKFSAANPNTSGLTGIPGNLAVNVGSASTWTRLWILSGSAASIDTDGWQMVRMA